MNSLGAFVRFLLCFAENIDCKRNGEHKDNCSVCGDLKRSKTCIMDQVYDNDIRYGDIVCYGCRGDIMRHLAEHHQ